jgi:hypothetical protein
LLSIKSPFRLRAPKDTNHADERAFNAANLKKGAKKKGYQYYFFKTFENQRICILGPCTSGFEY